MCKSISCSTHSAFFDAKYCWLLLVSNHIFKKMHYKQEIYSNEFPLMHSEKFLQPKTGCKIIIIFILTNVKIKKY